MFGEYIAIPDYSTLYPDQEQFVINGSSGILSLTALSLNIQNINLPEGWSFMSTYMDPFETHLDSVFEPVVNQLIICKDGDGLSYWPIYNVNMIDIYTEIIKKERGKSFDPLITDIFLEFNEEFNKIFESLN